MDVASRALSDPTFSERYELGPRLGEGGMGAVYRGVQRALGRPVAIKFLGATFLTDAEYRERFVREAKLAAGLIHSNVVAVFDFGLAAQVPFLVTELIEGQTLASFLERTPQPEPARVLLFARNVLDGLEAIHRLAIVHRDLKPANVLVGHGEPPVVKIADFGIAKQTIGGPGGLTAVGVMMGSPAYLAPEQVTGDPVSPATDLYAFSIVLYRMVLGRHPFNATSATEMLTMQRQAAPELPPDLVPGLRRTLECGLAKPPHERPSNAAEYRAHLAEVEREVQQHGGWRRVDLGTTLKAMQATPPPGSRTEAMQRAGPAEWDGHTAPMGSTTHPGLQPAPPQETQPSPLPPERPPLPPPAAFAPPRHSRSGATTTAPEAAPQPNLRRVLLVLAPVLLLWALLFAGKERRGGTDASPAPGNASPGGSASPATPASPATASAPSATPAPAPAKPSDAPADVAAQELKESEQLAASGRPTDSATRLFALLERLPSLRAATPAAVARGAIALEVDRVLCTIVDAALGAVPKDAPAPPSDPRIPLHAEPFLAALAAHLARREYREAHDLLLRFRHPPGGAGDGARLHRPSALEFVQQLLALRIARSPDELMTALRHLEKLHEAHPQPPLATWSEAVASEILSAAELSVPRRFKRIPAGGWPRLEAGVEETMRHLRTHWFDAQRPRLSPAELRRALLVSELVVTAHDPRWRETGNLGNSVTIDPDDYGVLSHRHYLYEL
jgi:serine/threonine-protein kinase